MSFIKRKSANTRGANEANDFALHRSSKLSDRNKLENAVLDVLEPVVVLFENLHGVTDRVILGRPLAPGDLGEPIKIVSGDIVLGRRSLQVAELVDLLVTRQHLHRGGFVCDSHHQKPS